MNLYPLYLDIDTYEKARNQYNTLFQYISCFQ